MVNLQSKNSNELIELCEEIARSGEGIIYKTNKDGFLAKIYHSINQEKIEKLQVMVDNPPIDPTWAQNHISIAWPKELLKDGYDRCLGFLMPEIKNGQTLINVYNPSLRDKKAPGFNWYYLHTTALNVVSVIQALHHRKYVVGDLKPENLLVNERGLVSIIDTDSFQIFDSRTGKVYYSPVASQEYTPPEMFGQDLQATNRSEEQDRFGLAVIIWLLLFGYHPFSGKWLEKENQPSIDELIRDGCWIYGFNSKIYPHDLSIPLKTLHPDLQKCFHKCFSDGHNNPSARPSATEWMTALDTARKSLVRCSIDLGHYYASNYGKCYWCERKQALGFDIFFSPASTSYSSNNVNVNPSESILEVSNPAPSNSHSLNTIQVPTNYIPRKNKIPVIQHVFATIISVFLYTNLIQAIKYFSANTKPVQSSSPQSYKILPDVFLKNYISTLNRYNYQDAWNYLSPEFKQNKCFLKNGYSTFEEYWEQFEKTTISIMSTSSKTENDANVDVHIRSIKKDGTKDFVISLRLFLIWDENAGK